MALQKLLCYIFVDFAILFIIRVNKFVFAILRPFFDIANF